MEVIIIGYFDGSVHEDTKIGIASWYYEIFQDDKLHKTKTGHIIYKKLRSSGQIEFSALMGLLHTLNDDKYKNHPSLKSIIVYGDNKDVINYFSTNNDAMYFKISKKNKSKANKVLTSINAPIRFNWIPRRYNKKADKLCREIHKSLVV